MLADALSSNTISNSGEINGEIREDTVISIFSLKRSRLVEQILANLSRLGENQATDSFLGEF